MYWGGWWLHQTSLTYVGILYNVDDDNFTLNLNANFVTDIEKSIRKNQAKLTQDFMTHNITTMIIRRGGKHRTFV